uniref:Angiomotin C-terminal domain-containing protein n=1 Tax=Tetranychus urticae TaxID=32264 RepID=T1KEX7_TETUR
MDSKTIKKSDKYEMLMRYCNAIETQLDDEEGSRCIHELENYSRKISKLQKLECELQKVHQAHEDLIRSSDRKEKLEKAMRFKLEIEIKNLREEIKNLRGEKERLEIELQAQRLTLEEQRNHIGVLDNALMNAQNDVAKLEGELRKKIAFEKKATHLQNALRNIESASERQSQMEKRVRNHLEAEINSLRKQLNGSGQMSDDKKEIECMKKTLLEYEEKIITLENEVAKWEGKYFEESTMRHIEVNAASAPKDAKIAALKQTSQESEKMIQEARNERLRQMDELHDAHKRIAQLESKVRDLEAKLAEKDAMVKVLQQHSREKDVVLQKSLLAHRATPGRHTRSVSSMGLTTFSCSGNTATLTSEGSSTSVSEVKEDNVRKESVDFYTSTSTSKSNTLSSSGIPTIKSTSNNLVTSNSTSSNSTNSTTSNNSSGTSIASNHGHHNLDEQLKELDKRLISKDSIIRALRSEKERFPNHFWRMKLDHFYDHCLWLIGIRLTCGISLEDPQ